MSMLAMLALSMTALPLTPQPIAPVASTALACADSADRAPDCGSALRGTSGQGAAAAPTGKVRNVAQARAKPCNSDSLKGLACRHDNMRLNMESKSEALATR
jgi:hypothetical protein